MRSIEEKGCSINCPTEEKSSSSSSCMIFDFKKNGGITSRPSPHHHRSSLGKPAPSKWDDAQKWLVNLSGGEKIPAKASPRNSQSDDKCLIAPISKKDYLSSDKHVVETKNVECDDESVWRRNEGICLRDMGTEMTPITSKEPSRATTPIRSISPVRETSRATGSGPAQAQREEESGRASGSTSRLNGEGQDGNNVEVKPDESQARKLNPFEARAAAWEEAERAKYTARYKCEDVRIQAWESRHRKKAELENRKIEAKVERMKSRAEQKCKSRIASARRIAEEKRAAADAKLEAKAMKTSEMGDCIRRNGHLPSSFSFKLPSCCW